MIILETNNSDNILIYFNEDSLKPVGGPSGYLYNLLYIMKKKNENEISFIKDKKSDRYSNIMIQLLGKILRKLKYNTIEETYIDSFSFSSKHKKNSLLNSYSCVHFHSTFDLYANKRNLANYKGVVVLTSHSPKVSFKEYKEDIIERSIYEKNPTLFDYVEEFDDYAFKRADYIIFPCPGAEEPYYHSWPKYAELRDEKKIRYIPTGILPVECKKTREEIRNELNISQDAIVLSFVGRHNEVKGYDILQSIFSKLENVYVVCCGKIGSIQPPKSDRWIEVGWTTDPYSYVGASDIYMLPNRETYFDIAMLQTLSIGKCSVISNTGGNKEFTNTPGVKLYDTVEEAVECIKEYMAKSVEERSRMEDLQRKEFEEKYTIEVFYKNYKETLRELLKEKNNNG